MCALACLFTACALRPGVELKQAVSVVERGLGHVYKGLDAEGVDLKVCATNFSRRHILLCSACWGIWCIQSAGLVLMRGRLYVTVLL